MQYNYYHEDYAKQKKGMKERRKKKEIKFTRKIREKIFTFKVG